jgi:rubrerythrin
LDRAGFLALGVRGGAAVAVGAACAGVLVDKAPAATAALADLDVALARLAVGAEVLAVGFYTEAIAAKRFGDETTKFLKRALLNEQEHLTAMSEVVTGAGQTPSTADDFEIAFPDGTFGSRGSIAKVGVALETAFVGAYLGAVDAFVPADLKTVAARIAACEAQHLSVFTDLADNRPVGISFPAPIEYETASDVLDAYLS